MRPAAPLPTIEDDRASVLVVDDDPSLRRTVSSWIESFGYAVRTAAHVDDALEAMRQTPSDMALCDVGMLARDWRAAALGVAADGTMADLEHGARLHDIGKLDVPLAILTKSAPLHEGEWEVMRTHPQLGYDLVRELPRFAGSADLVLAHHEAFDDSGYRESMH